MGLIEWANKWGVPLHAVEELRDMFGLVSEYNPGRLEGKPEAVVSAEVRLEAAEKGGVLWRNNVGATFDERGNFIRYGLCNDSKGVNKRFKSSDLIGIKPVVVGEQHIGHIIGQFCARETKRVGWSFRNNDREQAQLRFIELVISMGGDACFATGKGTL